MFRSLSRRKWTTPDLKMATFSWCGGLLYVLATLVTSTTTFNIVWKSNNSDAFVIDGAFAKSTKVLGQTVKILGSSAWKFTVDEMDGIQERQPLKMGFRTYANQDMRSTRAPKILQKLMSKVMGTLALHINEVQGRIIERGDFGPIVTHCSKNSSKYLAILVLSRKWLRNDYGEIIMYDRNGDILRSVHPRYGRVLMIKCGMHFKIAPPCINREGRHYFLFTEFGDETDHEKSDSDERELSLSRFFDERSKSDQNGLITIDPETLIKKKIYTSQGKGIFVYDNAIPSQYVDILHDYINNHADYYESPVHEADSADNVKWIISLDDPGFVDGPIWNIIKQLLKHCAGKEFFPYDLACNHVRRTDNTHIHKDNYEDADEFTVLIYLNKDWRENDYGETTFLEGDEIIGAVRPRYGRVAIFHGTIDHSAHPASPVHHGARYTFAIKTAASIERAMTRIFETEGSTSYTEVLSQLRALEATGTEKQRDFAKATLHKLQSGNIPGENLLTQLNSIKDN